MITAKIYDGASPSSLLATMSQSRDRQFLHQLNEVGSGQMKVHKRDVQLAARRDALHYGNIVRVLINGVERFAWIIESRNYPPAPEGELSEQYWDVSGRGVLALLEDAIVFPEGSIGFQRQRRFDWTAIAYDDSAWTAAVELQTQDSTTGYQDQWYGQPAAGWPQPSDFWIWSRASTTTYPRMPIGTSYFRKTFTIASAKDVAVFATADNRFEFFLDGEQILEGHDWREYFRFDLPLAAGTHQIAVKATNDALSAPTGASKDPAGLLATIIEVDENGMGIGEICNTDSSWLALDYPASVPGMTLGEILRILLQEAQARGVLPGVSWTFTDSLDSNGTAWTPSTVDLAIDIGTSLLDVTRTLVEQFIDIDMSPSLVFTVDAKGTFGQDLTSSVNLRVGIDFEALSESGQDHQTNSVLARDTTGLLTTQTDPTSLSTHKRRETYLELALAASEARAQDMSTEIMTEFAYPTLQVSGRVKASSGVYVTWQPGDLIKMPNPLEVATETTVMSIAVEEDEAGWEVYWIEGMQDDLVDVQVSS